MAKPRKVAKKVSKKDLGSGLHALFNKSEEEIVENQEELVKELSHTVAMIPVSQIEVNPNQPRLDFHDDTLNELAESIKIHGLIQPVTVRRLSPNEYQLISGERRWRASKMSGLDEIPAYIRLANDQEMLEMALVENIQRENLNPIEIAITYQRLKDECALTDEKLSERVGKKRSTITNHLRLLKLPDTIQLAIKKKQLTTGHAKALVGVEDYVIRHAFFQKTINQGLSVRALEKMIRDHNSPKDKTPKPGLSTEYEDIQKNFRSFFGAKVQLKLKGQEKGQIVIPFDSVDELNRLLDRIDE